jgi:hypothetical protein
MRFQKKQCAQCPQWFTPTRMWQKFCSTKCRNEHGYAERKAAFEQFKKQQGSAS